MKAIKLFLKRLHFKLGVTLRGKKGSDIYVSYEAEMWAWYASDLNKWQFEKGIYKA